MNISTLIGKTLLRVTNTADEMVFETDMGERYRLYHEQSCCESVEIEDIIGDLSDLVGGPILLAEERTNSDNPKHDYDSHTWTFYELATLKGRVSVRWYGSSNGYYSESVSFERI
jgi:hypothetical protein